ncbi:MAG TPA: NUDIX domain-containing protein [Actinophytocola sp.]|jgi:8-oxo-dGTP diphosphatase|nr:NUDIX domain-containing protein [Actinophytocola sp.]
MRLLRTTLLVDAPSRVVSAALTERALFAGDGGKSGRGGSGGAGERAGGDSGGGASGDTRVGGASERGSGGAGGSGAGGGGAGGSGGGDDGVLAPGDELTVAGGRYRVAELTVDGLLLVPLGGPPVRLLVRLAPTGAGVLVTATAAARTAALGMVLRRRLLALLTSTVDRIRERAETLTDARVVVGTAIVRDRTVLAQQRAYPAAVAGRWELPGGRVEPGESDVDAVRRECLEELGVDVRVGAPIGPDVALGKGMLLRVYRAGLTGPGAVPHPHDHQALRWLTTGRLGSVDWLPADRVLLPALRRLLADCSADTG